jgi:hypothetical protein
MNLYVFYRLSDKGNQKDKLPYSDKHKCLLNALYVFGKKNFHVIADNCLPETINFIRGQQVSFEETALGNSPSFVYMVDKIIKNYDPKDAVYLLEDDYIHRPGSLAVLLEGLEIAEYVTLYDHPDKYFLESTGRGNPYNNRNIQSSRLYLTANTHWRETNSTTMTFACRIQTLAEDYAVWRKYTITKNPKDFWAFTTLTQNNFNDMVSFFKRRRKIEFLILFNNWIRNKEMRRLISSIPAYSTHTDINFISPLVNWENILQEYV